MTNFSILLSPFWTGPTGKQITAAGKNARIVATYLLSCQHTNMIGVYRIPVLYIAEETGLKQREAVEAIDQLSRIGFLKYDRESEFVWVLEMARIQNGLLPGEAMKEEDNRVKGIVSQYKHLPSNPFLAPFFDRYHTMLHLPIRRDFHSETTTLQSTSEGASKPLPRDLICTDPGSELDRKGVQGETNGSARFEKFWNTYPRKKSKGQAEKAWAKIKPDHVLFEKMLAKLEQAKASTEWMKDGGQFIPYPATWLNAMGWEDEYQTDVQQQERIPL